MTEKCAILISFASKIAHLESPAKTLCDFQFYMPQSIQFEQTNIFECSTGHCLVTDFICHGQKTCAPLTLFTAFLLRLSTKLKRLNEKRKSLFFFLKKKANAAHPFAQFSYLKLNAIRAERFDVSVINKTDAVKINYSEVGRGLFQCFDIDNFVNFSFF